MLLLLRRMLVGLRIGLIDLVTVYFDNDASAAGRHKLLMATTDSNDSYTIPNDWAGDTQLGIRIYDRVGGADVEQDATLTAHAVIDLPHAAVETDATYTPPAHDYTLLVVKLWATIHGAGWSLVTSVIYRDWETDRKSTRLNSSH